jgi:tetratricopeptide (TPR) repeat protein
VKDVKDLWDQFDLVRFTPALLNREEAEKHAGKLESALKRLEGEWKIPPPPPFFKGGNGGIWGLILALSLSVAAFAAAPELFDSANASYEKGDFTAARDAYEGLIGQGLGGFSLYYNLGNTYYRLGQVGRARLWYERALRENPRDEDARYNLDLVRSQIQDQEPGSHALPRLGSGALKALPPLNLLFFILLGLALFREEEWLWWARWIAGLLFAAALALAAVTSSQRNQVHGVVLESRAEVRAGPGTDYRVAFTVPEGRKVVILSAGEWLEIGVPEKGLKGWARKASVEPI